MITREDVVAALDRAGYTWTSVEHPAPTSMAEADAYIEGHEGVRTKTLFVVNRKRTRSYLLVVDSARDVDLNALAEVLEETRLSIGSADRLRAALDVEPGTVSPFTLLDPGHREPVLLWDREILREPTLTFHPGTDTETIFIGSQDMEGLMAAAGVQQRVVDIP